MLPLDEKALKGLKPLSDPIAIYLNDHLGGATAGLELFRRAAATAAPGHRATLERLASEVGEDRDSLLEVMARLEVPARRYKVAAGWLGEKLARFKPNGQLVGRSPLAALIELETLVIGVRGKEAGWRALQIAAQQDDRLAGTQFDELIARAQRQQGELEDIRQQIAADVFAKA